MKKEILIISNEFPPTVGGAGVMAYEVASALSTYKRKDINITLVTKHIASRENKNYLFKLIEVKTIPKIGPYSYWNAIKKLNLKKFEKIIINDIGAALVAAIFFNYKLKQKSIVFLHGSEPESILLSKNKLYKLINFKSKYLQLLANSHRIIAVSNFMKEKFIETSERNELRSNIDVVYNGIDFKEFYRCPSDLYVKYNIPRNRKLILSVSRVVKNKGYDDKYQIFKELVKKGCKYHWFIVGDGEYLDTIKERAIEDEINSHITFVGRIARKDLKLYYSSVDVFWLLSNYDESLGLVYIEASKCGCPVIGKNRAGAIEAIYDQKTGFLINDNYECLKILEEYSYENLPLNEGDDFLEKFNIENNIEKLLQIL